MIGFGTAVSVIDGLGVGEGLEEVDALADGVGDGVGAALLTTADGLGVGASEAADPAGPGVVEGVQPVKIIRAASATPAPADGPVGSPVVQFGGLTTPTAYGF